MQIRLQETLRSIFYTPFYAAFALGAFDQEKLEIQLVPAPPKPSESIERLLRGEVDVNWGGPMRVLMARDRDPALDLVCMTEVVRADPFLIVGREPNPQFRLTDLAGRTLATVKDVPTPWACLQDDLRRANVDPALVKCNADRAMSAAAEALKSGKVEAALLFEPFVSRLTEQAAGHIWYAAAVRGPTAYTSFYCRRTLLRERRSELLALTRAIYRVQKWAKAESADAIARAVTSFFPEVQVATLVHSIERYKSLRIWSEEPTISREGYDRLSASLRSAGLVRGTTTFADAVDNTLALEILREIA